MSTWLVITLLAAGGLFLVKIIYALSIAAVLPATGGALFVATSPRRIAAFLDAVPMRPDQVFVDLGCGDGRVLRHVRRRYGTQATGYEINPLAYALARLRCAGLAGIDIRLKNFWNAELSEADIIFCYLYPDIMKAIAPKLFQRLKPGATVVSCNFPVPGYPVARVLRPDGDLHNDPIFIYRIQPAQPEAVRTPSE
jgi:SAM-dependent methyltransferase